MIFFSDGYIEGHVDRVRNALGSRSRSRCAGSFFSNAFQAASEWVHQEIVKLAEKRFNKRVKKSLTDQ
jgi:hypothetical protein